MRQFNLRSDNMKYLKSKCVWRSDFYPNPYNIAANWYKISNLEAIDGFFKTFYTTTNYNFNNYFLTASVNSPNFVSAAADNLPVGVPTYLSLSIMETLEIEEGYDGSEEPT